MALRTAYGTVHMQSMHVLDILVTTLARKLWHTRYRLLWKHMGGTKKHGSWALRADLISSRSFWSAARVVKDFNCMHDGVVSARVI